MFSKAPPAYAKNEHFVHLKKGFNIKLDGEAKSTIDTSVSVTRFAVSPYNFRGIAPIPKVLVAKGDTVKAGDVLFFDKTNPDVKYVSPVSGEIEDVTRGAKRSISNVIIIADKDQQRKPFDIVVRHVNSTDIVDGATDIKGKIVAIYKNCTISGMSIPIAVANAAVSDSGSVSVGFVGDEIDS